MRGKIEIVTAEKAEAADCVVCVRVCCAELVARGSRKESCSSCGEKIFVAPSSPAKPRKICVECAIDELGPKQ